MGDVAVDKLINKFNAATGKDKRFLTFALKETGSERAIPCFSSCFGLHIFFSFFKSLVT